MRHRANLLPVLVTALALTACGSGSGRAAQTSPAARHANALAVDPRDGTILVGTDTGLYRVTAQGALQRIGRAARAVTGLAFAPGGTLLASGHPEPGSAGQQDPGLERSDDGGLTFRPLSRTSHADLRLLRTAGRAAYGLNATTGTLMAGSEGGRRWEVRSTPPGLADLAVDPVASSNLVGSSDSVLWRSSDGAATWERTTGPAGAVTWTGSGRIIVASLDARLHESRDGGHSWTIVGRLPALLVALAERRGTLLGLLANAGVVATGDGGAHWELVARP